MVIIFLSSKPVGSLSIADTEFAFIIFAKYMQIVLAGDFLEKSQGGKYLRKVSLLQ